MERQAESHGTVSSGLMKGAGSEGLSLPSPLGEIIRARRTEGFRPRPINITQLREAFFRSTASNAVFFIHDHDLWIAPLEVGGWIDMEQAAVVYSTTDQTDPLYVAIMTALETDQFF